MLTTESKEARKFNICSNCKHCDFESDFPNITCKKCLVELNPFRGEDGKLYSNLDNCPEGYWRTDEL